jgi:putative DNA primase/helicase
MSRGTGPTIVTAAELMAMSDEELDRIEARRPRLSTVAAPTISPTTEEGLALAYAARHAGELRYVAEWARWMRWNGSRWAVENTLAAFDLARAICRETAEKCNKAKESRRLLDARTVVAVEKLAKADRRLAATVDQMGR